MEIVRKRKKHIQPSMVLRGRASSVKINLIILIWHVLSFDGLHGPFIIAILNSSL